MDQFLLSCVELSTLLRWLDTLFAAIDVAAPIEERDFPRDQSIPRIQRIRWFRGQSPVGRRPSAPTPSPPSPDVPQSANSGSSAAAGPSLPSYQSRPDFGNPFGTNGDGGGVGDETRGGRRRDPIHRLSTTSYPNVAIDDLTGKWAPQHNWGPTHDMLYAKLCYSALLFQSPRKSRYIIDRGKKFLVDWATGMALCTEPPGYSSLELYGPWQVLHTQNARI